MTDIEQLQQKYQQQPPAPKRSIINKYAILCLAALICTVVHWFYYVPRHELELCSTRERLIEQKCKNFEAAYSWTQNGQAQTEELIKTIGKHCRTYEDVNFDWDREGESAICQWYYIKKYGPIIFFLFFTIIMLMLSDEHENRQEKKK